MNSFNNCKKCKCEFPQKKSMINYVYNLCEHCFESRKKWAVISHKCLHCEYHLLPIGERRINGVGVDWDTRYLHLKCMKDIKEIRQDYIYRY